MSTAPTTVIQPGTIALGVTPVSIEVQPNDTIVITNDSSLYPEFDVIFLDESPNGEDFKFHGTSEIKILVTEDGTFDYMIRHHPKKKGLCKTTGVFSIRSCTGGCH